MKNVKIRALTDTAVAAALCALFIIIAVYVPPLSFPVSLAIGIPLMYISCKWDWKFGILASICASVVSFILIGNVLSVAFTILTYGMPGLLFGICESKGCKFSVSVAVSAVAVMVGFVAELMILNGGGDGIQNLLTEIGDNMTQTLNAAVSQTGAMPEDEAKILIGGAISQSINLFKLYIPSIVIIVSVIYSYCISMMGIFILKRLRIRDINYTRFYMMSAPKGMCLITALLFIISYLSDNNGLYMAALQNLSFMLTLAIAVCGLSAFDYKLRKKIPLGYVRAIIYAFVFFAGSMLASVIFTALVIVGYIDGMSGNRVADKG